MTLSVVISTWKRPVQLKIILSELNIQASENNLCLEVIISDSYSGKETDDVVNDIISTSKNIKIIHKHTKNAISSKRNFGASLATENFIVFLDDDCVPAKHFISDIINDLRKYGEKTVLCGEVRFEPRLIEESNYYRYRDSLHPKFENSGYQKMNAWTFVSMNCVIARSAFQSGTVSYNENFIGYGCEDHEFGWQLEKNNFEIVFSKGKIIHHEYGGDIEGYARKIYATARDGMNVLTKIRAEMFVGNKRLTLIEWFFNKNKKLGSVCQSLFFNDIYCNLIIKFLKRTDKKKYFYITFLYRYVLISHYIKGMKERGKVSIDELYKNWYV